MQKSCLLIFMMFATLASSRRISLEHKRKYSPDAINAFLRRLSIDYLKRINLVLAARASASHKVSVKKDIDESDFNSNDQKYLLKRQSKDLVIWGRNIDPDQEAIMLTREAPMLSREALLLSRKAPMLSREAPMLSREAPMLSKKSLRLNKRLC